MAIRRRVGGLLTRCLAHRPLLPLLTFLLLSPGASAAGLERRHVLLLYGTEKDLPMWAWLEEA